MSHKVTRSTLRIRQQLAAEKLGFLARAFDAFEEIKPRLLTGSEKTHYGRAKKAIEVLSNMYDTEINTTEEALRRRDKKDK